MAAAGGMVAWNAVSKQADRRDVGQHARDRVERRERNRLMDRGEVRQRGKRLADPAIEANRRRELRAPVDDPMSGRLHGPESFDRPGKLPCRVPAGQWRREVGRSHHLRVLVEDSQLEAARPGIDDEDPHAPDQGRGVDIDPGQLQLLMSGGSWPSMRVYARLSIRRSAMSWRS